LELALAHVEQRELPTVDPSPIVHLLSDIPSWNI
jgi:hypothetical protein